MYLLLLILGASWTSEPLSYSALVILITSLTSNYDDVQMTSQKVNYTSLATLFQGYSRLGQHFNTGNSSWNLNRQGAFWTSKVTLKKSTIKNGHGGIELNPSKRDNRKYL